MTNSTGNTNGRQLSAIPDVIYPAIRWRDQDYAGLQAKLELFDDFIVLSKYRAGEVVQQYIVDPAEVAAALSDVNLISNLLPRDCLFWGKRGGDERLGLYVPPQIWPVVIRNEPQAWRVPLPGLIFVGCEYDYTVWAVTERPASLNTPLYMAPCPNVHPEGVCRGSAPFPRASASTIRQAVDIFFSSKFNNDLSNHKSKAHPKCVVDQWRALHAAGAETYPLDDMVKTDRTLVLQRDFEKGEQKVALMSKK